MPPSRANRPQKKETHPSPPINPPFNPPSLDQSHHKPLHLPFLDPERGAHARELDRREGLEVEHERAVADECSEVLHVWVEVDIEVVPGLGKCVV